MIPVSTKRSQIFLLLFFLIVITVIFFEFSKKKNWQKQKDTIIFWQYWSGVEKKPLEELVQKFNSENQGFKVKMLSISMPKKKIMLAVAGKAPPDLVHLDGDMVSDFALRNALEPLDSYFEPEYFEKFIPIYVEMLRISTLNTQGSGLRGNDAIYALPLMPTCEAMHINKKLLGKYGLDEPKTLEDMVEIFDVMRRRNDVKEIAWLPSWPPWAGSFLPTVFGGAWAEPCAVARSRRSFSEGDDMAIQATSRTGLPSHATLWTGSFARNDDQQELFWCITANSPENIAAWTWVQENFARKINPKKLAMYTEGFHAYQSPDNPFYAGFIAFENNGVWEKNLAKIFAPELEVSVKAFPGKVPNATYVTVDALAIPRGAKHAKQAAEFIRWLHKSENLEYLALAQQKFTPLKNHSKEFIAQHPNPYIDVFINLAQSPNAKYFPQLPFSQLYKREIKEAYLKVVRLELSPEEALEQLQARMEKLNNKR